MRSWRSGLSGERLEDLFGDSLNVHRGRSADDGGWLKDEESWYVDALSEGERHQWR